MPTAKFTRSGTITISGGTSEDGERVFISVADTGLGIPKDKFGQIFGAFEQVDMSTTRSYGGTGLGLHLVKQLVEAHNGGREGKAPQRRCTMVGMEALEFACILVSSLD